MATVRSSRYVVHSSAWVAGLVLVVGLTALLPAQSSSPDPAPTTQPAATQPAATQPTAAAPDPRPERTGPGTARLAGPPSADPEPPREPSATDILRELTRQANAPGAPIVRPSRPGQTKRTIVSREAVPANAIPPARPRLLPDGYRLVDRPGRLAREGDYWVYSFESRSQGAPELPIRLLPNRLLEDMEDFSEGGTKPVVFLISGEVTEYHNVNYLLVQKLLTRPDLGNLQ